MDLSNVLKDIMVKCMLNPDNKDFYIGTLTVERIEEILIHFNDPEFTQLFWSAFEIAQAETIKRMEHIACSACTCPECGCSTYIIGAKCPNCDYEER